MVWNLANMGLFESLSLSPTSQILDGERAVGHSQFRCHGYSSERAILESVVQSGWIIPWNLSQTSLSNSAQLQLN